MNINYVNVDFIIEKLHTEKIPGTHWTESEVKEWIYDALSKINAVKSKIYDNVQIEIIDGKGLIPAYIEAIDKVCNEDELELFQPVANKKLQNNTYLIDFGHIYTNFESGFITMYYFKFPIDDNGDPLIPDKSYFIEAILYYLKYKLAERAWFEDLILERQFRYIEQKWLFYLPSAQASSKRSIYKNTKRFRSYNNRFTF